MSAEIPDMRVELEKNGPSSTNDGIREVQTPRLRETLLYERKIINNIPPEIRKKNESEMLAKPQK